MRLFSRRKKKQVLQEETAEVRLDDLSETPEEADAKTASTSEDAGGDLTVGEGEEVGSETAAEDPSARDTDKETNGHDQDGNELSAESDSSELAEDGDPLWHGPYSAGESPEEQEFLDLQALRIPMIEGVQIAPIVDSQGQLQAIEVIADNAQMQLAPFAMQKSGGLWEQVLEDLKEQLEKEQYSLFPLPGPYGEALLARPKEGSETAKAGAMSMLLWGIEGERWMLRVIIRGAGAEDQNVRQGLHNVLRHLEVVRGDEAMIPGELIPMVLPKNLQEQLAEVERQIAAEQKQKQA